MLQAFLESLQENYQNQSNMRSQTFKTLFFIILISSLCSSSFAQTPPAQAETLYKDWQVLPDSKNMVEIFYCIVKCNGVNKIHLKIFNDGTSDQDVQFSLDIINSADNKHLSINKRVWAKKGTSQKADCDSDTLDELKISLPSSYDPLGILVKQTQ